MNRSDGEEQIAVARFSILCRNYRRLRDEQLVFFERPDVFADRVRTQLNRFTDFSVAWPALESLPIFAEQKVGVDRDLCRAQTQRENFFRQREVVLDRIACRPEISLHSVPPVCCSMSPDEIEWIMRQSTWSLEVEGQHPDAQTMEWCRQMLAGEISLEKYLDLVIRRATE